MSNVVDLPVITTLPLDPKRVLAGAADVDFDRVIIIGRLQDGSEYFASSEPDGGTILWDMERVRHALMKIADDA
ncbi:hypothetical protein [Rhizobium leguminosarum]|uniref:hypothetical protein n=1 Tax=Rhizobium leguminosarum TaxID=384 RepID=UPI00160721AB|nr:hypothetical protein [Rhizobium leguminosarum]MBB4342138.1 hypothetical protein [Rhizobium leguminosarum]MBB6294762.1 hypothetical protein [Rhizobium leguminosarum]